MAGLDLPHDSRFTSHAITANDLFETRKCVRTVSGWSTCTDSSAI